MVEAKSLLTKKTIIDGVIMNILIIWRDIPTPKDASLARPYYLIKYNLGNSISLVSFDSGKTKLEKEVLSFIDTTYFQKIPQIINPVKSVLYSIRNKISDPLTEISECLNLFRVYHPKISTEIADILQSKQYDVIFADYTMYPYLLKQKTSIPTVLVFQSPRLYSLRQQLVSEKELSKKFRYMLEYFIQENIEAPKYKKFAGGIYVSQRHRELDLLYSPRSQTAIPPGFEACPCDRSDEFPNEPTLIFVGDMSYPININAVEVFYKGVYPLIKAKCPDVRFIIAGRNPTKDMIQLCSHDSTVTITGEVNDIRQLICASSIVVIPIFMDDGGVKTKTIEAMGLRKAIVSTSIGAMGLNCTNGRELLIADSPEKFAECVIDLISDENKRTQLAITGYEHYKKNYSWYELTRQLFNYLDEVVKFYR